MLKPFNFTLIKDILKIVSFFETTFPMKIYFLIIYCLQLMLQKFKLLKFIIALQKK